MAAVQDADLHRLIGVDMRGEGDADLFQRRTASGEMILQHPLAEGFAGDGNRIGGQPELRRDGAFAGAGGGGDAVDHAIREGDRGLDPGGECGVRQPGKADDGVAGDDAIAGQVVAGHHGKGRSASGTADLDRGDDRTKGGDGLGRVGGIAGNLGGVRVKGPGGGVDEIAAFGHGQRHDADGGISHRGDQRGIVGLHFDEIDHRPDPPRTAAGRVQFDHR